MFLDNVDGSAHGLTYDTVLIHTINWIESRLGLDTIPVTDNYRYASKTAMLSMTFSIVGLISSAFTIVYFFGKFCSKTEENSKFELSRSIVLIALVEIGSIIVKIGIKLARSELDNSIGYPYCEQ